jgi:hypothetical protein
MSCMQDAVKDSPLGSAIVRKGDYFGMPFYIARIASLREHDHVLNIAANCYSLA